MKHYFVENREILGSDREVSINIFGLDFKFLSNNVFTLNEYRIIKLISITLCDRGQAYDGIMILDALNESLCNKKVGIEIKNRLLPNTYYNLSDALIDVNNYQLALNACDNGVKFCRQAKNCKMLPYLFYNMGKAQFKMGHKTQAEESFKEAMLAFCVHGNKETAERAGKMIAEKYQIYI
jgi:tetratricopeptide (TPR) repeat protein